MELPSFIIKRLPVRLTFDNNYFNALYQGIPVGGYTRLVEKLLAGIEVRLGIDYLEHKTELDALAEKVVYTGPIDAYFGKDEQGNDLPKTVISREYSSQRHPGDEPYYPVNDEKTAPCTQSTKHWRSRR